MKDKVSLFFRFLGGIFLLSIGFTNCEKPEERMLGKEAIPEGEGISTGIRDSFELETRTVSMPPVPAFNSSPGMFGKLKDPRAGITRAAFFSQILLPGTDIELGDPSNLVLDSAVLSLRYTGYYGDTTTAQEFAVHQVIEHMEGIDPDHPDSLAYSANTIGSKTTAPKVNQSVELNAGDTLPPHLRIRLKDSFGENILDRSGTQDLADDASFVQFINGIMITSRTSPLQEGEGSVLFVEPVHENSRITLYYRDMAQNDTNTLQLEFGGARFNQVVNDPSGSELEQKLGDPYSSDDQKEFVLGPGEVATEIRFPDLKELVKDGAVSVNRAILELPVVDNASSSPFPPSNRLHILYRNSSGNLELTEDVRQGGVEFFGGTFDPETGSYRMRITRHIQAMLNGEVGSDSFFVSTSIPLLEDGAANTVSRVALNGPASSEPPRLEVIYTEY